MDDDDGMELNISFTKPVPKPKIVKEIEKPQPTANINNYDNTDNKKESLNKNNKRIYNNDENENTNNNNNNKLKQNNNNNNNNNRNNNRNNNTNSNEYKQNNNKVQQQIDNTKHRYKQTEEAPVQYYSSNINKYKELEKGKRFDSNYKPKLPTLQPKTEFDKEELFSDTANFGNLSLSTKLTENLTGHMQLQQPTLIQSSAIPPIMENHDVLVKAQTGSGKTLAYLIPVVNKLSTRTERINRADGSYCIVVAPTRELSIQIFEVLQKLLKPFHWIVPGLIMGGESRDSEKARLRKGISILVATPGRLLDHLKMTKSFKVDLMRWLVLDEADRLLDLGFEKAVNEIIQLLDEKKSVQSNRQNILVSATLSDGIERLAAISLNDPVYVGLDKQDDTNPNNNNGESTDQFNTPKQLDQMYVEVETKERLVTLVAFLKWITTSSLMSGQMSKIIIFFSSCDSVEFHHYLFSNVKLEADKTGKIEQKANTIFRDGGTIVNKDGDVVKSEAKRLPLLSATLYKLHGDIEQKQRTETFLNFKKAKEGILLTTDVSARGLDLPAVNWIVQYDPCSDTKDYVHRIGRTARLGQQGSALLFLTPQEKKYVYHLNKFNIEPQEMKVTTILQSLYHTTEGQLKKTMKTTQLESQVHDLQLTMERFVVEDNKGIDLARSAYKSSLRAYATHKANLKYIFHIGSLHLGHVSKSFALRETPTELNKITAKQDKIAKKDEDTKKLKKTTDYKMKNYMETNEFGNGLGAGMANSVDKKRVHTDEFTKSIKKQRV